MPMPEGWTTVLFSECIDRCAEFGDPQCLAVEPHCLPCDDCLIACGIEPAPSPPDPAAVVRPLL